MKHLFTFYLLLTLGLLVSACKKDEPVTPATPTTGTLSGTVSPVGSITQVTAKNSGGLTFPATPNATTGAFSVADLAPGSYTLSFAAASGYKPVADRTISIVAGQNAAAGTVQATSDGTVKSGTMSWTVNGQTYTTTAVTGQIDRQTNGQFYVVGKSTSGNIVDAVSLGLYQTFYGAASYSFSSIYTSAAYQRTTGGITTFNYLCSGNGGGAGNGTMTVTQYDEAAGTASGTFGFVGVANGAGSGSATVTNGTFSIRF